MKENLEETIEKQLTELFEKSTKRNYIRRTMNLSLDSTKLDDNYYKVVGKLEFSATEDPNDDTKLKTIPFEVMFVEKNIKTAVDKALLFLNVIPSTYGDVIFEDGFLDILNKLSEDGIYLDTDKLMESSNELVD